MKIFIGIIVAAVALNCVLALPAPSSPSDDAEVIDVPRRPYRPAVNAAGDDTDVERDFRDFKGIIDTGSGYPFLQPVPHAFSFNLGFFDSFEDIFRRLRTRLWPVQLPGADGDSSEEGGFSLLPLSPKNGNTTSTVKIVDGHKIEINDTTYGDDNSSFKIRVVKIRPVDSDEGNDDTVINSNNSDNSAGNAATSAPKKYNENDDDDSDERREPLEKKTADENEISADIDGDAEVK